jgi:hypothetical protein
MLAQALGYWIFLVGCWIFKNGGSIMKGFYPALKKTVRDKNKQIVLTEPLI